jgi:hypothetical protein
MRCYHRLVPSISSKKVELLLKRSSNTYASILDNISALHVHMCADEVVVITIDPRSGKLNMRDTGDLATAGRVPRFMAVTTRLNENPEILYEALSRLRLQVGT